MKIFRRHKSSHYGAVLEELAKMKERLDTFLTTTETHLRETDHRIYNIEEKLRLPHFLPEEMIGYTNLDVEDKFPEHLVMIWEGLHEESRCETYR